MRGFACGLLALGALGFVQPAGAASSAALVLGNSIEVGDATITVVNCASSFCGPLVEFAAAPGPNVGFVIESATNPGVNAFLTSGGDLTVSFEVVTTTQEITSIGLTAKGTGNASVGETVYDSVGCTINTGSPSVLVGSTTSIPLAAGYASCHSTTEQEVMLTKNIAAHTGTVDSVTQYLDATTAPEPLSSAVFAVGLLGLAAVRRRAR